MIVGFGSQESNRRHVSQSASHRGDIHSAEWYYNWLASRLDNCEQLLRVINVDSAIGNVILNIGLKAADALERLLGLAEVNVSDEEKYKSVQEKLQRKLIRK